MQIVRTYKYRVYPTPEHATRLAAWQNAQRFLWNLAHEQRLLGRARPAGARVYPTAFDQQLELTELRREHRWLADVPYNCQSALLQRLHMAWQRHFKSGARVPRWKRKGQRPTGLHYESGNNYALGGDFVRFPKLGALRAVIHRAPKGRRRSISLTQEGDQWFACLVYEQEVDAPAQRLHPRIGIDRGITYTLADSDGNLTPNPKHYEKALKRLAHAQRVVSRRKKGSKNREKAKLRVMRIHRKVRRQREHFLHVESARLAKSHGVVVIEKLNVAGMSRGNCARGIAGAGWSQFSEMLEYKLTATGGTLVAVPAHYSSQTCAVCGLVDASFRRGELFACACGHRDHADLNAAKVILGRASRAVLPVEGLSLKDTRRIRKQDYQPETEV